MARNRKKKGLAGTSVVAEAVAPAIANVTVAPDGMQRFLRFGQLAAEGGKQTDDIFATMLAELDDIGIPREARDRIKALGTKQLKSSGFEKSVTALLGKQNLKPAKEILRMAQAATKGMPKDLGLKWTELLDDLAKDSEFGTADGKRIIAELRKIDPKVIAKVGSNQAVSAFAKRGADPFLLRMFNKVMKRENTAVMPQSMQNLVVEAAGGKMPKVSKAAMAALEAGGMKTGQGLVRKLAGKALGPVAAGGFLAFQGIEALGREDRAKQLAIQGFEGMGPSSSTEFLRHEVNRQETLARRKVTLQRFEPELFTEVVRALSQSGAAPNQLTSTERRIGSQASAGAQATAGRSGEDVQFLLDQLFQQMG